MNLIKELWNGDKPLVVTYWLYGILPSMVFHIIDVIVELNYVKLFTAYGESLNYFIYCYLIIGFLYSIFIFVAIWRSAEKYTGNGIWSALAKFAVILGIFSLTMQAKQLYESWNIKPDDTQAINKSLQETAVFMKKSLPQMVDNNTKLYDITTRDHQIIYHYQIIGLEDQFILSKRESIRASILTHNCTNEGTKEILNYNVTMSYRYKSTGAKPLIEFDIQLNDCK